MSPTLNKQKGSCLPGAYTYIHTHISSSISALVYECCFVNFLPDGPISPINIQQDNN
jgi:hypothetical protein